MADYQDSTCNILVNGNPKIKILKNQHKRKIEQDVSDMFMDLYSQ